MNYEKNKEALAIVRQMISDGQVSQEVAEIFFPELKESEDEKMLDELINYCELSIAYNGKDSEYAKTWEKRKSWLKSLRPQKQCNYNPYKEVVNSIAEMCKHYDNMDLGSLQDFYDNVKVKCKDAKEYDSLFPQSSWKPSYRELGAMLTAIADERQKGSDVAKDLRKIYQTIKETKGGIVMIYIYRTLWLLFYLPLFIIEVLLFTIGIPVFIISGAISFIVYGDVEETPDWCIPGRLSIVIDYWYKDLLKK